jgi:hypothetical protein
LLPANGSAAIAPSALFNREIGHRVVALYDNEPGARKLADELKKQKFPDSHVIFIESTGKMEADIEDMFSETFYLNAVNEVYKVILKASKFTVVDKSDLAAARQGNTSLARIVPILEAIWASHKADGWGDFNKSVVCDKICSDILKNGKIDENHSDAFQKLFDRISKTVQVAPPAEPPKILSNQPTPKAPGK